MLQPDDLARLEVLAASEAPGVLRFDAGPSLAGEVAILPSAFNPPTLAHRELLEAGLSLTGVAAAAALLTTRNVAKGVYGAPFAHRVGMLLAMAAEEPPVGVLATNVARFVDQAAALEHAYPEAEFHFIAGYDTLVRIFDPRYYRDMEAELGSFFARHRLVVTNREGGDADATLAFLASAVVQPYAGSVRFRELSEASAGLSSTAARKASAAGDALDLVPPAVARYIREHGLYAGKDAGGG